jgi:hypothetical protein
LGITGTGAVLALMLQQKTNASAMPKGLPDSPNWLVQFPLFFWILESQWKHFQRGFYPRVAEIELILAEGFGLHSPKIYSEWSSYFKRSPNRTPKHRSYR